MFEIGYIVTVLLLKWCLLWSSKLPNPVMLSFVSKIYAGNHTWSPRPPKKILVHVLVYNLNLKKKYFTSPAFLPGAMCESDLFLCEFWICSQFILSFTTTTKILHGRPDLRRSTGLQIFKRFRLSIKLCTSHIWQWQPGPSLWPAPIGGCSGWTAE